MKLNDIEPVVKRCKGISNFRLAPKALRHFCPQRATFAAGFTEQRSQPSIHEGFSMAGFTKLFSSIVTSSIWVENDATLRVWIAMLATSNAEGLVEGTIPGFANLARVTIEAMRSAEIKLLAPDKDSRSPENDGRRIERVPGGWLILNYEKYRDKGQEKQGSRAAYMRIYRDRERNEVKLHVTNVSQSSASASDSVGIEDARRKGNEDALKIYELYPRKVAKPEALRSISKAIKLGSTVEFLIAKTTAYAKARQGEDPQFTPHPSTWFNQQRFNDDEITWKHDPKSNRSGSGQDPRRAWEKAYNQPNAGEVLARRKREREEAEGKAAEVPGTEGPVVQKVVEAPRDKSAPRKLIFGDKNALLGLV